MFEMIWLVLHFNRMTRLVFSQYDGRRDECIYLLYLSFLLLSYFPPPPPPPPPPPDGSGLLSVYHQYNKERRDGRTLPDSLLLMDG